MYSLVDEEPNHGRVLKVDEGAAVAQAIALSDRTFVTVMYDMPMHCLEVPHHSQYLFPNSRDTNVYTAGPYFDVATDDRWLDRPGEPLITDL